MSDLLTIPPLARTLLYYALAIANAVVAAGFIPDARVSSLVVGLAGVFGFTLAASNVSRPAVVEDVELLADDLDESELTYDPERAI